MLESDEDAGWEPGRLRRVWAFRTGRGHTIERLNEAKYRRARDVQRQNPFLIGQRRGTQWWWYRDGFYRDESGLLSVDVKAILHARD